MSAEEFKITDEHRIRQAALEIVIRAASQVKGWEIRSGGEFLKEAEHVESWIKTGKIKAEAQSKTETGAGTQVGQGASAPAAPPQAVPADGPRGSSAGGKGGDRKGRQQGGAKGGRKDRPRRR